MYCDCGDSTVRANENRSGIVAKVNNIGHLDILFAHCIIHRERLMEKKNPKNYTKHYQMLIKLQMEVDRKSTIPEYPKHFVNKWVPTILTSFTLR